MADHPVRHRGFWDDALVEASGRLPAGEHSQIFHEDREDLRVDLDSGSATETIHTRLRGLSARGGPGGRRTAFVADPDPSEAAPLARKIASATHDTRIEPPASRETDPAEPRLDREAAFDLLQRLLSEIPSRAGRVGLRAKARWVGFDQVMRIARPGRPILRDERHGCRLRLEVRAESSGAASRAVGELVLRSGQATNPGSLARQVVQRAIARLESRTPPAGEVPVVFAPGTGGVLIHELVGHALEADTVLRQGSRLIDRSHRLVLDEHMVVVDDPGRGRAPWLVDDEGEHTRATPLIEQGRVVGLLHCSSTASRCEVASTGHGRRSSFHQVVRPRMGCTFLAPGPLDPDDVLEGMARGVYIRRMEAGNTDTAAGAAVFRVTDADLIHRGRLDVPIRPFLMQVSTLASLSSLDRIASDLVFDTCVGSCVRDGQPLATSVGAPTFRIGLTRVVW